MLERDPSDGSLPPLEVLVEAADRGLHPWVRAHVSDEVRRWLELASGGHVLAGPRYLGLDPDLPFVGVAASDRPLVQGDRDSLVTLARDSFAAFAPG